MIQKNLLKKLSLWLHLSQSLNPSPRVRRKTTSAFHPIVYMGLGLILSSACVTVNVNFPENAAQSATDDYVRDLYRTKEHGKTPPVTRFFHTFTWIAEANAADGDFRVDTDKANKIKESLRARVDEILDQKKAGILGESMDGLLILKNPGALKSLLLKKTEKLVAAENKDRDELYEEVLNANKLPLTQIKKVARSFARSFQGESPSGTWIQAADESWSQKR